MENSIMREKEKKLTIFLGTANSTYFDVYYDLLLFVKSYAAYLIIILTFYTES